MADLNRQQFHEMSKEEFADQPGTYFHGTASGVVGSGGGSFHVGTKSAATQALGARLHGGSLWNVNDYEAGDPDKMYRERIEHRPQPPMSGGSYRLAAPDPQVIPGRIAAPMVNAVYATQSLYSDEHANGRENQIRTKAQQMRQGIFYVNTGEDAGSVSAVIPNRAGFKTHEDFLVEARSRGKKIPPKALAGYDQIPGQQRMVF